MTTIAVLPADSAGAVAVTWVSDTTVNVVAGIEPNVTAVAPVKPEPVTVTLVPPAMGPLVGLIAVIVGAATQVNTSAGDVVEVPPTVVTVRSPVPVPAGAVAVTWVSDTTVNVVAGIEPNVTAVTPVKPEPVTVTLVPPVVSPSVGARPATIGGTGRTVSTKFCCAALPTPFPAPNVTENDPDTVGIPLSVADPLSLSTNVTPPGRTPVSVIAGTGYPVPVRLNV